jgi:Putative prokaryotic signal transducing protein
MKLVTVYRAFSPADAQLICSLLQAHDIPAMVADELSALSMDGYAMATGGIRVQVPEEQVENARALIENKDEGAEGPDPSPSNGNG